MVNYLSKAKCLFLVPTLLGAHVFLSAADAPSSKTEKEIQTATIVDALPADVAKISEAFGHLIGKNIETLGFQFDIGQVVKGLQDSAVGKESPMNEMECVQAISEAQEAVFKKQAAENLIKADEFLAKNAKEKGVVVLEEGKLQYKLEKKGEGAEVQSHYSPLIRYTGKFLDGTVFGSSKEDESISLDETIPGISKGLVGMKEGEKRTIYIHPDLGYGATGHLPPNSLLAFEVEIVKAQAPQMQELDSLSSNSNEKNKASHEIASPDQPTEALR
ncbi:MAG TPA: FKBP-type peptidyl-prolyl cis-trans isomerase [Rhabdochlamydiaceae bacterium]|nr:FKBP-type peptidyl-prolyl cis-trans isomerase [Rhabdochlamydiaceae bacterium]